MPTAIREVDLASPFRTLDSINGYNRCMLVFRWRNQVAGQAFVEVRESSVAADTVARAADELGINPSLAWLAETLGYDQRETVGARRPTATIALCTRERPDDLARALRGVCAQTHAGHDVLVVDNAPSTDRTIRMVEQFPGVRYVCEPTAGLNVARNRAIREATGEVVAFTDDDATPEPGWLDALLINFGDPRVQCVTGLTLPLELETEAQELFETISPFGRGFRRRIFDGQRDNPLEVGQVGAGANMAIRRTVLSQVGPFDERLDAGTPARSGGDHEMFVRILAAGHRICYDPAAVSWHRHRRTMNELSDTLYGYGVGVYAMWTGLLLERRELGVARLAWSWFRGAHLSEIARMLRRRPETTTSALVRAELRGCLHGPAAWFTARRLRAAGNLQ
jgi:glycosyltransferase involved in cell wall biosynthesis